MKKEDPYLRPDAKLVCFAPDTSCMLTTSTVVGDYPDPFTPGETW